MNIGLLFLFAITSIGVYGVALAGWSSNSKYPLLGGLRSSAQMISYELSLTLSVVGVMLMAGTLNFQRNYRGAARVHWGFLHWNLFGAAVSAIARASSVISPPPSRKPIALPFDLAEAETELVAGFHTEYSSFKFAMFFMAEYANMITVSCLATILFFGGWLSPFPDAQLGRGRYTFPRRHSCIAGVALILAYGVALSARSLGGSCCPCWVWCCRGAGRAVLAGPGRLSSMQGPFWFLLKVLVFLVHLRLDARHACRASATIN